MDNEHEERPFSVLLLSRNAEALLATLGTLRQEGLHIESICDVYRAVATFAKDPADAVVAELDAFEESELECIRIFRELNADVYILAVFSQAHRHKAARVAELGADACLLQPFYPGELISILRRWAERGAARRSAEALRREHLVRLRRLARGAAHEINNPLTTLSGWLEMMESEEGRSEQERQRFASMREETARIARVVRRLLALGLEPPAERALVDVNAMLRELLEGVSARAAGVKVEAELRAEEAMVLGDEALLREAAEILLDDAVAALDGKGTLSVRMGLDEGGFLQLSVRDDGRCIPAEHMPDVFEPYSYTGRASQTTNLAYPTLYGIVRCHGGELTVTSEEGRGTEFLVRLPGVTVSAQGREV